MGRGTLLLVVALLAVACGGPPDDPAELLLDVDRDVNDRYTRQEDREDPEFMRFCGVGELVSGVDGAEVASRRYWAPSVAGDGMFHTVAVVGDADPHEVLGEVERLIARCGVVVTEETTGAIEWVHRRSWEIVGGPDVGDEVVWVASRMVEENALEDGGRFVDPSPTAYFVARGALHRLTAPPPDKIGWDDAVEFVVEHAERV
jgi:hypothetical protein